jgi:hypothetical protein
VYATHNHGISPELGSFIDRLDSRKIKLAVVFNTGFAATNAALIQARLRSRGIAVAEQSFYCGGQFMLFNRKHPNQDDLLQAAKFAQAFIQKGKTAR